MKITTKILMLLFCCLIQAGAQWSRTELSQYKDHMAVAVSGDKVYFAGGFAVKPDFSGQFSTDKVEIYDTKAGKWTYDKLSIGRDWLEGTSAGSKVIFAGGWNSDGTLQTRVDIYDTLSRQWTQAELSEARRMLSPVSTGQHVMFAGGQVANGAVSSRIDVYDSQTGLWNVMELPLPRLGLSAVASGDQVMFAGGLFFDGQIGSEIVQDVVDIYNLSTKTWGTAKLSTPRAFMAAAVVGNKILFAGGQNLNGPSNRVDIYDVTTGIWSIDSLSVGRAFDDNDQCAAVVCGKAYFVGGMFRNATTFLRNYSNIDVYDPLTGAWEANSLPYPLFGHSVAGVNDKLVVAGGVTLVPQGLDVRKEVHIFSCTATGLEEVGNSGHVFQIFPNPCDGNFAVSLPDDYDLIGAVLTVYDLYGMVLMSKKGSEILSHMDVSCFQGGVYFLELRKENQVFRNKLFIHK
jgi:N-acetylneuraminic acid mutarotase